MLAPGKYDFEAEGLRQQLQCEGLILIVAGGPRGSGLSVKSDPVLLSALPGVLRTVADLIEMEVAKDLNQIARNEG